MEAAGRTGKLQEALTFAHRCKDEPSLCCCHSAQCLGSGFASSLNKSGAFPKKVIVKLDSGTAFSFLDVEASFALLQDSQLPCRQLSSKGDPPK